MVRPFFHGRDKYRQYHFALCERSWEECDEREPGKVLDAKVTGYRNKSDGEGVGTEWNSVPEAVISRVMEIPSEKTAFEMNAIYTNRVFWDATYFPKSGYFFLQKKKK